ncbi:MAG: carboxymuconolactone decarboxylase family protein [Acetobacteraceae bacterium]|nr:carboxymuconolactone decarboxylase family protein [Acetobacteraceae bacterium]
MANRFPVIPDDKQTPEQKVMVQAITSGPRGGGLRGPFNALMRSPDVGNRVQHVGAYVRFSSCIGQRLTELGIIMVARKWTAQYEWYAHRALAEKAGLSPMICDAIAAGKRPVSMAEDESLVYNFAKELLDTTVVSDATYNAMKDNFSEQGVVDLICSLGYYSLVSMVLNVAEVPLPPDAVPLPILG